jgi:outer membrane protein assembly factor BamB
MKTAHPLRTRAAVAVCALLLAVQVGLAADLTFLHLSDVHYPHASNESAETIAALPRGPLNLQPYGITAEAPAFAIVTGDLNEFGGGNGNWEGYLKLWKSFGLPVYHELGNHDNTWDCSRPRVGNIHGSPFYAFEHAGAKFIGFDTATPQDPRPSIATEGLRWLEQEFARTPPEQPVIFFCHHPLNSTEFASEYARSRLLDVLQTRNVVLMLVGHGHSAAKMSFAGMDAVEGGSAYGPRRGFNIVSVKNNVLRVCHQYVLGEAKQIALLEKPLPHRSPFLKISRVEPADGALLTRQPVKVAIAVAASERAVKGRWVMGERQGELRARDGMWRAQLPVDLAPGAHSVRLELIDGRGLVTARSRSFWINSGPVGIRWRRQLGGSVQAALTLAGGRLYVGSNDGVLQALDAASGTSLWSYQAGGEVRGQPALLPDGSVCAGSSNGSVFCVAPSGKLRWTVNVGSPVYASLSVAGDRVLCATNSGEIIALDAARGAVLWRCDQPRYTIESGFAVAGDAVFTGSWDGNVYALSLADGRVRWKAPSRGSNRQSAALYYSPADCPPVWAGGNPFVTDRGYYLSVFAADTGELLQSEANCSAVAASADGNVYVRHTDSRLSKRRPDGSVIWESRVAAGYLPVQPVEASGRVWVTSGTGLLSALNASTGALAGCYQASPGLYVFAAPAVCGDEVCVADEAGQLLGLCVKR